LQEHKGDKFVVQPSLSSGILGTTLQVKAETISNLEEKHGRKDLKQFLREFNVAGDVRALTEKEGRFILG